MTKISKKWMNLDFNDPGGLTADDIPFSAGDSLKAYLKATTGDAAEWVTIYVAPNGTGSGESFSDPTNLEAVRQKYDNRHTMLKILMTSGGEYVLQDIYHVYGLVLISFDQDNATLDWANNPPIICTPHTTSSYIAFDPSGSKTCQAHNYSEQALSVGSLGFLYLENVVVRGTLTCLSIGHNSVLLTQKKTRFEVWAVPSTVRNHCYGISNWSGFMLLSDTESTDYSDNVGIYLYLPDSNPPSNVKCIAAASKAAAYFVYGWYNFYVNWQPSAPDTVYGIDVWNMSRLQIYSAKVKHTNLTGVLSVRQGSRLSSGLEEAIAFQHDYDPTVSDHRSPIKSFLYALHADVELVCDINSNGNTHYCSSVPIKASKSKFSLYYPPKFAPTASVDAIVSFEATTGIVERPICDDITYGSATIPIYAWRHSDLLVDYSADNSYTTSLLGDATSTYGTFTADSGSCIAVKKDNATLNMNLPVCAYPTEESIVSFIDSKLQYKG